MSMAGVVSGGSAGLPTRGSNWGERVVALVLLVVALPLLGVLALFLWLTAGAPVLYGGTRLGAGRKPFRMWKLRTLRVGANAVTGSELLGDRPELTVRGGRFLRDSRLDELPQLWNIVRGEMSFVGPRPERPEVFEAKCADIPGYEQRFAVRPGLIGISQLFTPHGTPKRYRALIDNRVLRQGPNAGPRLPIVAFTIWSVLCLVTRRTLRQLRALRARLTGRYRERRSMRRVRPQGALVHLGPPGDEPRPSSRLLDLNSRTLRIECVYEPGIERATEFELVIPVHGGTRPGHRTARCTGRMSPRRGGTTAQFLVHYEPSSERSEYMLHQYFLRDSLALAPRSWPDAPPAPLPPPRASAPPVRRPETLPAPTPAVVGTSAPVPVRVSSERQREGAHPSA